MTLWEKVVEFHGHACCILAVGYRAATLALEKLGPLAGDDRLAAVVETVDCSTDAVQVVLRCTLGSRRLLVRERGKYAFTVARPGKAVRLALKPGVIARYGAGFAALMEKVANGIASPGEKEHFNSLQQPLMDYIMQAPAEELFNCRQVSFNMSGPGFNFSSVVCEICGEEVFTNFVLSREGKHICLDCAGEVT